MTPAVFEKQEIIIDASCFIHLWKCGLLTKLNFFYSAIHIPLYVKEEIGRKGKQKRTLKELIENYDPFLQICEIGNFYNVKLLYDRQTNPKAQIDRGEAEVIVQALERQIPVVLIDDRKGRKMAKSHTLIVKGTLGILNQVKRDGLVEKITPFLMLIGDTENKILRRLQVSQKLFSAFLSECEEFEYFKNSINQ